MIRSWLAAAVLILGFAASTAPADDTPAPPPAQGWSGKGQLGYVMSRGTSDTDSANAKLDLADLAGDWKYTFHLEGLYGRSGEITSAEQWATLLQADYQITARCITCRTSSAVSSTRAA